MNMRHASLFSGIGGFDLAAHWMGWTNVFQVEIDKAAQKVLAKRFPTTTKYKDIKTFDGTPYFGSIDVISGGFPCQPFSLAGARKGTNDNRYLWPHMLRIISEVKPTYVVAENVCGLLSLQNGLVFEQACAGLEDEGYSVQAFIIPACGVDAPHRRNRIWIVANSNCQTNGGEKASGIPGHIRSASDVSSLSIANPKTADNDPTNWQNWPSQSPLCGGDDGISDRMDRLKQLGNAIVPSVAYNIFKGIANQQSHKP